MILKSVLLAATFALAASSLAHAQASADDRAFVGKVSQGGAFEAEAGKLAEKKAVAQDVKDFAATDVHDHDLVNAKLKSICGKLNIPIAGKLNAELQGKLDGLNGLNGPAFDAGYMKIMGEIHQKDGGLFAIEAKSGGDADLKAFAAETVKIVNRHIGAIHGAMPE